MKKRKWIWIGLAVILIASVLLLSNPQIRTNLFVRIYHEQIEEGLKMHAGVPADDAVLFGYKYVNTWEGEHSMVEFLITTRGDTYYGCYYSPDDVPVIHDLHSLAGIIAFRRPFPAVMTALNQLRSCILECQGYYFEASF